MAEIEINKEKYGYIKSAPHKFKEVNFNISQYACNFMFSGGLNDSQLLRVGDRIIDIGPDGSTSIKTFDEHQDDNLVFYDDEYREYVVKGYSNSYSTTDSSVEGGLPENESEITFHHEGDNATSFTNNKIVFLDLAEGYEEYSNQDASQQCFANTPKGYYYAYKFEKGTDTRPDLSWPTGLTDVKVSHPPHTYTGKFYYNSTEGYSSGEQGEYFVDNKGDIYTILEFNKVSSGTVEVKLKDLSESMTRPAGGGATGYVYTPRANAPVLTQAQLNNLNDDARDVVNNFEKFILWSNRGIKLNDTQQSLDNITSIKSDDIKINLLEGEGWNGGQAVEIELLQQDVDLISINQSIDDLTNRVDDNELAITNNTNAIATNTQDIADLQTQVDNFEIDPDELENLSGVNGAVFITNIQSNESNGKILSREYRNGSYILNKAVTDTKKVTLDILAVTGNTNYKPAVSVLNENVMLSEEADLKFTGTISIDLEGKLDENSEVTIDAIHEDGAEDTLLIKYEEAPLITSLNFTGLYPAEQTEVKEGDQFLLQFKSDQVVEQIEILEDGAGNGEVIDIEPAATSGEVIMTIGDTAPLKDELGLSDEDRKEPLFIPALAKVKNESGSWSEIKATADVIHNDDWKSGIDESIYQDGVEALYCNNHHPALGNDYDIVYPNTSDIYEGGLELDQIAEVYLNSAFGVDPDYLIPSEVEIKYEVLTSDVQLMYEDHNGDISEMPEIETTKSHFPFYVKALNGIYTEDPNIRVTFTKVTNKAQTVVDIPVVIADPQVVVDIETEIMRSSSSGNIYTITLRTDQKLLEKPELNTPAGSFISEFIKEDDYTYKRQIEIDDSVPKGTHSFFSLSAKNLADKETTTINTGRDFKVRGFTVRKVYFNKFSSISNIGTEVTNTRNLNVIDMSNTEFSYSDNKDNNRFSYTITDSEGNIISNGNYIYIIDQRWVDSNSTGTAYVEIEEVV